MRSLLPIVLLVTSISILSAGCSTSPPADKPDTASASEVVLLVPSMT